MNCIPVVVDGMSQFNSKKDVNAFIDSHFEKNGLDYRVGFFV